jgi:AraC-like DNA-binding protein/quercetin dioxygenase-like cupin family protein
MLKYDLQEAVIHGDIGLPMSMYKVTHNKGSRSILPAHWHHEFEIIYISRGSGIFKIDNIAYIVEQGNLLIINSQELHSAFCDNEEGCDYYAFVFNMNYLSGEKGDICEKKYIAPLLARRRKFTNYISANKEWEIECIEIVKRIVNAFSKKNAYYELYIKGCLFQMMNVMYVNNSIKEVQNNYDKGSENIESTKKVIEYIEKNYSNEISIDDLAQIANLSKYHFIRTFSLIIGVSPIKYINLIRVNEAANLLQSGHSNITEVANKCGFDNVSYFIKTFKSYKRETPNNYRKMFHKQYSDMLVNIDKTSLLRNK